MLINNKYTLKNTSYLIGAILITGSILYTSSSSAAIALDRTRVIFDGANKTISLSIKNDNTELPYLAQAWIEDMKGQKISSPFVVLPPVQRVEAGDKSQVKIQSLPAVAALPQDQESVFYFNLREVPPKSKKSNVLQIALQTKIKLFYRPESLYLTKTDLTNPWQEKILLERQGGKYRIINPTPYFVTIINATNGSKHSTNTKFDPIMIDPKGSAIMPIDAASLGTSPVLSYINDYGGRPELTFSCQGNRCSVVTSKK